MNKLYTVIMRAQPLHKGHEHIIKEALSKCLTEPNSRLLVLLGSSNKVRSMKNPFTFGERQKMVREVFDYDDYLIQPLPDFDYDDNAWEENLHKTINNAAKKFFGSQYYLPVLVSGDKDGDDELRKSWARGAEVLSVSAKELLGYSLSATSIREEMCKGRVPVELLPNYDYDLLLKGFDFLKKESENIAKYKELWKGVPFPVQFSATDALIRDSSGRYLLIERGGDIGEGYLALVGGFLEEDLTYEENMKKEVKEEVGIDLDSVPHSIVTSWLCDEPNRDVRARITTVAFLVQLHTNFKDIDNLCAGDDAKGIYFCNSEGFLDTPMWADHCGIARKLLNLENS